MTTRQHLFGVWTSILLFATIPTLGQSGQNAPSHSAAIAPTHESFDYVSFTPTKTFENLDGTRSVAGNWDAEDGIVTATIDETGNAILLLDAPYQDLVFASRFRCEGGCKAGMLLRTEVENDITQGILYELAEEENWSYKLIVDAAGREFQRERLNTMPWPYADTMMTFRAEFPGLGNIMATDLGGVMEITPLQLNGEWNHVEITLLGHTMHGVLNGAGTGDIVASPTSTPKNGYIGLYASGPEGAQVQFKEVGIKPMDRRSGLPVEITSSRFKKQHLESLFQAESATAADFNMDGHMDVNAGPNIFFGPDFTERMEIFRPREYPPNAYPDPLHAAPGDFTRDGYPDLIHVGEPGRPGYLYVNPGEELRRWDKYMILGSVDTEIAYAEDIDGDGELEYIYGDGGYIGYAKAGEDPTQPWTFYPVTEIGPWGAMYSHGMGTGDISGDGRTDIIQPYGWWEQPAEQTGKPWKYHPERFARWGTHSGGAGGPMFGYDINGDGLTDVVSCLDAHGFGLAWFEQVRDSNGEISFVQHMIMDDHKNPLDGVTFSELHALLLTDIDGDGLKDIVTGKRWKGHFGENPTDPDAFGDPVIYAFLLSREGGEVRFTPELINNRSGVGNDFTEADLNNDGLADIMTSTRFGTDIFLSQRD